MPRDRRCRGVNAQSILGAVSIYVLLGMLFVFVYGAAGALGLTLATLGYGDYAAAGDSGRAHAP